MSIVCKTKNGVVTFEKGMDYSEALDALVKEIDEASGSRWLQEAMDEIKINTDNIFIRLTMEADARDGIDLAMYDGFRIAYKALAEEMVHQAYLLGRRYAFKALGMTEDDEKEWNRVKEKAQK